MKISKRGMIFLIGVMLANNLLWMYAPDNNDAESDEKPVLLHTATDNVCKSTHGKTKNRKSPAQIPITASTIQNVKRPTNTERNAGVGNNLIVEAGQETPLTSPTTDMDVTAELSQDYLHQHAIDREDFFYADRDKKIDIIRSLSAQGDDLTLIREVLRSEEDSEIRSAALTRLNQQHSFVATQTLIDALDDPLYEVVLTALTTLAANGDRTLLPLLQEKMKAVSNNDVRDEYEKSIRNLKYSVTMGMDEITVQ